MPTAQAPIPRAAEQARSLAVPPLPPLLPTLSEAPSEPRAPNASARAPVSLADGAVGGVPKSGVSDLPSKRSKATRDGAASDATHLVFDAMRALRQEGRPDRASRLLDEYLSRFPAGPLTEEAMALSIEAKTRSGDPRAKALATGYLARFPLGQFRTAALRAQAHFSP